MFLETLAGVYSIDINDLYEQWQDDIDIDTDIDTDTKGFSTVEKIAKQDRAAPKHYIVKHSREDFYWHRESKFVFDKVTKKVIGIYYDGVIMNLNDQDSKICKTYGFKIN